MKLLYTITTVEMSYELINTIEDLFPKRKEKICELCFKNGEEKFQKIIE